MIIHSIPIFNGLYRSLTSISHPFDLPSFLRLASSISSLLVPTTIDRLNQLLIDPSSLFPAHGQDGDQDFDQASLPYAYALLAKYRANGRPLSGNLLICAGLEIQWTMLAQMLVPAEVLKTKVVPLGNDSGEGAEASSAAWEVLLAGPAEGLQGEVDGENRDALNQILQTALKCFSDMLSTLQTLRGEHAADLYPYEVLSESLVRHQLVPLPDRESMLTILSLHLDLNRNSRRFALSRSGSLTRRSCRGSRRSSLRTLPSSSPSSRRPPFSL